MSIDMDGPEAGGDPEAETGPQPPKVPPTPFPDGVVYVWFALLEGLVAAGLALFSISLLEGGEIIPDVLAEFNVSVGVFVVVTVAAAGLRFYRAKQARDAHDAREAA